MVTWDEIEKIRGELESLFDCEFILAKDDPNYLCFSNTKFDNKIKLSFLDLMKVAEIFGTLNYDVIDESIIGDTYSEYTKDPDTIVKAYRVAKDKIYTGLPEGFPKQ